MTIWRSVTALDVHLEEHLDIKPGIHLPTTDIEWLLAKKYFQAVFSNISLGESSIEYIIKQMNETIYDYFKETCGIIETCNKDFNTKYKDYSIKSLKKQLKSLKSSNTSIPEIKFVSCLIGRKLKTQNTVTFTSGIDHDKYISKNFWNYIKRFLQSKSSLLPSFSATRCTDYFSKTFSALCPNKRFTIPSWIPSFDEPIYPFDTQPPSYQAITSLIRRMKASTSPCPLDKISIICFKRCPYLRSLITQIIRVILISGSVPSDWKKASMILIHKKDSADDPSNFRPITLESVPLKIFTSCLRDSVFTFLKQIGFIDHLIQKGFTAKISGTLKHTALRVIL